MVHERAEMLKIQLSAQMMTPRVGRHRILIQHE